MISLFLGVVIGLEVINIQEVVGTVIFIVPVLLVSDISKNNMTGISDKTQIYAIILRVTDMEILTY